MKKAAILKILRLVLFAGLGFRLAAVPAGVCAAVEEVPGFDGFPLRAVAEPPEGAAGDAAVGRVAVFLHGSGPQNMDEDFSSISAPGEDNRWFVDVSRGLRQAGIAVVRYNKRSYEAALRLKDDAGFARAKAFKDYAANPLRYFVDDARHFVAWAGRRFPSAKVFLLGHSEGAYVALQVARQEKAVAGLALVGFTVQSLDTALYEQFVYRPLGDFSRLDLNRDGRLDARETGGEGNLREALRRQARLLDLDGNGFIDESEFVGGNLSNIVLDVPSQAETRAQEARYPRAGEIIRDLGCPIVFFQGEWDNQCRSFNAKAVEIMNRAVWKKGNLHFHYFPGLGHALDPRSSLGDLTYRRIDEKALATVTAVLNRVWR